MAVKTFSLKLLGPNDSEASHQIEVVRYLDFRGVRSTAPCNGISSTAAAKMQAKRLGMKNGAPDLFIFTRSKKYPLAAGLAIEMKRNRQCPVSAEQRAFLDDLIADGWRAEVCYGAEEAINVINEYYDS
jgi:hypothetical protein